MGEVHSYSAHIIGFIDHHVHVDMIEQLREPVGSYGREKKRTFINAQTQTHFVSTASD